jgi:hypothetical protein
MVETLSFGERLQYTKKHERHKSSYVTFVPLVALWFVPFGDLLVRSVAFVWFGTLLIAVSWWWPLIFPVVSNHLRRFFRRPFILVFALRDCPGRHHAEHRYHQ